MGSDETSLRHRLLKAQPHEHLSPASVTIAADTVKKPPFLPNRFTYTRLGADSLRVLWEVARNGSWAMRDSLGCVRAP